MADDQDNGGNAVDELEHFVDRFLERKLFGAVGPRWRSLALLAALALGTYTALRGCPAPSSPVSQASAILAADSTPTPTFTPWSVPGLR